MKKGILSQLWCIIADIIIVFAIELYLAIQYGYGENYNAFFWTIQVITLAMLVPAIKVYRMVKKIQIEDQESS